MHHEEVRLAVDQRELAGTLALPKTASPGILFIHGWTGSQEDDLARAQEIAALGCVCLTFDLRGHAGTIALRGETTPEQNLKDVLAAYDFLATRPFVDSSAIAVVGASYGAYLGAILTSQRPAKWLSLRVPALYRDRHWRFPKGALDRLDLTLYRQQANGPVDNKALAACAAFAGNVLVVESERDDLVPHQTVASYIAAFSKARSLTYRVIDRADHALSDEASRRAYTRLLVGWIKEMVFGART